MAELLSAVGVLLWPIAFGYFAYRVGAVLEQAFTPYDANADELAKHDFDLPDDIVALAMLESQPWAQEEIMRVARERYEETGNWNLVRSALGVAGTD